MIPGIGSWLKRREDLTPDREALVDGPRRLTYRQLNRRCNRLAQGLLSLGCASGQRIAVLAYNCLEYVETIMAAAKLGLVVVPLNWRLTGPELAFNVDDSGASLLIFDPDLAGLAGEILKKAKVSKLLALGGEGLLGGESYDRLLESSPEDEPGHQASLDDPHIIMYTAGTTGKPKGAVLSQGASFWNSLNLNLALDFTSDDRDLLVLPMFHIGGIGLFTLPMLHCGGKVLIQRVFDPAETIRLLREEKPTLFFGVPAVFLFLAQHPEFEGSGLADCRVVMSGGAPLPVALVEQYKKAGIILQQGFGMSEAAPSIATLEKEAALQKAGSIGRSVFHLEVRVADEKGRELPRGQVGELIMRGPNLLSEYWNRPQATAEAFIADPEGRGGPWFCSGDLARMDGEGYLFIVDRKKDMFISGGENVYPAEVEQALFELKQVAEAAVVGVPDQRWGEVGLAVVVLKEGFDLGEDEALAFLGQRLAKYKIPKKFVFAQALPRNAAGKVLKNELRERFA